MRRSSDWFVIPSDFQAPDGQSGGITTRAGKRCIHRTLLPALAPAHLAEVGRPLLEEEIAPIDTPNLRPYQYEAATFAREREGSLLALSMGCVTGDTCVLVRDSEEQQRKLARDLKIRVKVSGCWTPIRQLWENSGATDIRLLSMVGDGTCRYRHALGMIEKGKQPVVCVTIAGRSASTISIRLTKDHPVLTWQPAMPGGVLEDGKEARVIYKPAGELCIGEKVVFFAHEPGKRQRLYSPSVIEIIEDGEDEVFDISMSAPYHNFVADGFVVHNCGKTRTSLYAVREDRPQTGLIVAPKVTFPVWQKEIKLVFGEDYPVRVIRGRTLCEPDAKRDLHTPGINLINPELLASRWSEWLGCRLDYAILDEAHYYTHSHAKRTSAAAAIANLAKKRIALTGTPILRHVMDLHGILQAVAPGSFGSWQRMALWLDMRKGPHGWDLSELVSVDARVRLEARLSEVMVAKRWEEVSDDVPPLQRELLPVTFDDEDQERYTLLANDVREALGDAVNLAELVQASAAQLVQVLALRRFVGISKIPRVVELVRSAGEPVVVWTWHRDVAQETARVIRSLGCAVSLVTGEDPDKKRQQAILRFQQGEADVFVGTIAVGGVGIDLTRARITVFGELSWLPAEIAQAEARVFRTGQTRPCITYWPIFRNTIEERIIQVLLAKADHARSDIFPEGTAKIAAYNPEDEMVSLLDHAMEEDEE